MYKNISAIRENSLLVSLTEEEIEEYLHDGSFTFHLYGKNKIIHFPGDLCTKTEITLDGNVVVESIDEEGNLMAIAEFSGDEILGGNLLFSKNPYYPMTITAKQETLVLEINKDRLFRLFSDNHIFLKNYLEYLSDHAVILGYRIKHYANKTIKKSLINFLEHESKKQNSSHIMLCMTKKQLAEKIGVQRTSLSRELSKMREDGLITYDKTSVDILWK
jgi:CRP-like cAMP-binding protein